MQIVFRAFLVALAMLALWSRHAQAQDYPTRNVTILVPYAPGGGTDVVARLVGERLQQSLGKPFVIENRPGAGTAVAALATAKAAPDGYTLLQAVTSTLAFPAIYKSLPYDPANDLAPFAHVAAFPFVLVVSPSLPVHSIADLVKLAKEKPLNFGSAGVGTIHHLNAELFSSMTGIKMTHVPYRGSAPALTDLVSGQIQVLFTDLSPSLELIRAGKIRALGVTTADVFVSAPEIPPLGKVGLPGFDTAAWSMIVAPANTPRSILGTLNTEVNRIVNTDEVKKRFADLGIMPVGKGSVAEVDTYAKSELLRWTKVIRDAGVAASQ